MGGEYEEESDYVEEPVTEEDDDLGEDFDPETAFRDEREKEAEENEDPDAEAEAVSVVSEESEDEYSMENIIHRMDREELEFDLNSQKISFMSGYTDHELRALLRKAYHC
jgi:hypothetical protein